MTAWSTRRIWGRRPPNSPRRSAALTRIRTGMKSRPEFPGTPIQRNAPAPRDVYPEAADRQRSRAVKRTIVTCLICSGLILGLSACTNPYDPAQRFVGGGLLGAASGAAIGAAAGGGPGAAMGAAIGAAAGAFGGGAPTPPAPPYGYYGGPTHYRYHPPYQYPS